MKDKLTKEDKLITKLANRNVDKEKLKKLSQKYATSIADLSIELKNYKNKEKQYIENIQELKSNKTKLIDKGNQTNE